MSVLKLGEIQVLLVEPNETFRAGLLDNLHGRGLTTARAVPSVGEAMALARRGMFDLLIAGHDLPALDAGTLHRAIRLGTIGRNPFLVAFSTLPKATPEAVRTAIGDGPDVVLAKPFSVAALLDRVTTMIHARQPFLVTEDYVGPDRPQAPRLNNRAARLEVPNTLRDKALDQFDPARARAEIDAMRSVVETHILVQNALAVSTLTQQVIVRYDAGGTDHEFLALLVGLTARAGEIARRLRGTAESHVAELALSLIKVTDDLRRNHPAPSEKDIRLLQNLGMAIHMSLRPEQRISDLSTRIAKSVIEAKNIWPTLPG